MTGINSYSTTASDNVQANTGIDWDEGMAPGAVNNSARQNMADIRGQWNDASWFQYGIGDLSVAPVYASGSSFTLAGADATAYWHAGRRVKAVGVSTGTIYGTVSSSAFASSTTTVTVTWDSGALSNETLTIYASTIPVTGSPIPPAGVPGLTGRNRIINGDFRINQRGYVSAATLASGYGHDRWKAGASGGDYSFTQNNSDTAITIAAGKSLMQIVDVTDVEGGSYVLSWTGTAQARVAISGGTTSGAYAASPITVNGAGAGETITVEFDAGSLGKAQLEPGTVATLFERIPYGDSMVRCLRFHRVFYQPQTIGFQRFDNGNYAFGFGLTWDMPMRSGPNITLTAPSGIPIQRFADAPGVAYYASTLSGVASTPTGCAFGLALSGASAPATSNGLITLQNVVAWQLNFDSEL